MAVITPTVLPSVQTMLVSGVYGLLTATALGASDTLEYYAGTGQLLLLRNPTGGSITPTIDGLGVAQAQLEGYGNRSVGVLPAFAILAGTMKVLPLDTCSSFWNGTIQITGGTGLIAYLINPIP